MEAAGPAPSSMTRETNALGDPAMKEVEIGVSGLAKAMEVVCFPIMFFPSWWIQHPREESIILHFGVVTAQVKEPGCHYHSVIGREIRTIPTVQFCTSVPRQKVTDSRGNPINISAVITYRFIHPTQALLNVQSPHEFVNTQAMSALKSVVSNFSYEELKTETTSINAKLLEKLQPKVSTAGAVVLSCMLDELNYAPEIAGHMLKQQQARALIDARHLLVKGSVGISTDAVKHLAEEGVHITSNDQTRLVSSIVLISANDTSVQPVIDLSMK